MAHLALIVLAARPLCFFSVLHEKKYTEGGRKKMKSGKEKNIVQIPGKVNEGDKIKNTFNQFLKR